MAQFRSVVALAPACPLPYLHTALLLQSIGDVPGAIQHLEAACALSPDEVRHSVNHAPPNGSVQA